MKQYQCSCHHGHFLMFFILSAATVELSHSLGLCFAKRWRTSTHLSSPALFPFLSLPPRLHNHKGLVSWSYTALRSWRLWEKPPGRIVASSVSLPPYTHPPHPPPLSSPLPSSPLPHFRCPCHLLVKLNMTISWVLSHIPSEIHPFIWEEIPAGPT